MWGRGRKNTHIRLWPKNTTNIQPQSRHHFAGDNVWQWWTGARGWNSVSDDAATQVCLPTARTGTTTPPRGQKQEQNQCKPSQTIEQTPTQLLLRTRNNRWKRFSLSLSLLLSCSLSLIWRTRISPSGVHDPRLPVHSVILIRIISEWVLSHRSSSFYQPETNRPASIFPRISAWVISAPAL